MWGVGVRSNEDGVTLVEVLIATVILGLAVSTIVGGFAASVRSGLVYKTQAKAETVLRTSAEDVVAQGFKPCAAGALPTYPVTSPVDGFAVSVTGFAYWTGTNPASFAASCANESSGVGRISLRVTSPGTPAVIQDLDVFVRNAA